MRTGPTNEQLRTLISSLRKTAHSEDSKIWKAVLSELEKPSRIRRSVNLSRINRFTKKDDKVVVPGKVLGSGKLDHSLTVVAWRFSTSAKEKIQMAQGRTITLERMIVDSPKGKGLRLLG